MALRHLKTEDFDGAVGSAPLAMVDFWAPWCGYEGRALIAKVDVDGEPELARRFGVMNIPTVVFLREGREFDRKVGAFPAEVYVEALDKAL